jgi:peptide/nickel transport system substrate-binding protein
MSGYRAGLILRWGGIVVCLAAMGGCGGTAVSRPTRDDRAIVGTTDKPRTLDPADAYELRSLGLIRNMCERLYTYEPNSTNVSPQLATALPTISADGLTYQIPIRQGVLFHDRTPFNAAAMAFSIDRFIKNKGKASFLLSTRVESVRATGDYELTIELKQPFSAFTSLLAFQGICAVSPTAYRDRVGPNLFDNERLVGTGPYVLDNYRDERIAFKVFDGYWGQKPKNKGIVVQVFPNNPSNLYNAFRTGAIDIAYNSLEPDQIRVLQEESKASSGSPGWQTIEVAGNGTNYLMLNVKQKPLNNPLVRQAFAAVVDRAFLNERVLYGQGQPLYSVIPSTFSASKPVFKSPTGEVDIARAKALLKQAGYSRENPVVLEIWYPSGSPPRRIASNLIRAYVSKQLDGMMVIRPSAVEGTSYFKNVSKGLYGIAFQNWYPDFIDVDNYVQPFLECPKGDANGCQEGGSQEQGSFYFDAAMNQAIAQQGITRDPAQRQQILDRIQAQVVRDVPLVPLWQTKDYIFAQKGLKGVITDPLQTLVYANITK